MGGCGIKKRNSKKGVVLGSKFSSQTSPYSAGTLNDHFVGTSPSGCDGGIFLSLFEVIMERCDRISEGHGCSPVLYPQGCKLGELINVYLQLISVEYVCSLFHQKSGKSKGF